MINLKWSGGTSPLLFLFLIAIGLTGCGHQSFSGSAPAVTSLEQPVPASEQDQAKQIIAQFVSDVQRQHYPEAALLMSSSYRKKMPSESLKAGIRGPYVQFSSATHWQYDSFQYLAHGHRLFARAHFLGSDNDTYRTNFTFTKQSGGWMIDMILPPSQPHSPVAASAGSSASPGH